MHSSRLTLSWEDGIRIVSSYSVSLLVTWSPCCYILKFKCVDDLIILALFYSIIPKLFQNNSRIASAIKLPKIIPA